MDAPLRQLVTAVGGYDLCTSEFVRITRQRSPEKVFYRFGPELKNWRKNCQRNPLSDPIAGLGPLLHGGEC